MVNLLFSPTSITAVDIDEAILDVAKNYFGLAPSSTLKVVVDDGLKYLKTEAAQQKYDAILFDVDSKDSSQGISCPPRQFVEPESLNNVKSALSETGIFVLNLVCRDDALRESVVSNLMSTFPIVLSYKLDDEVNEIIFCTSSKSIDLKKALKESMEFVNSSIKSKKLNGGDPIDVSDVVRRLNMLSV